VLADMGFENILKSLVLWDEDVRSGTIGNEQESSHTGFRNGLVACDEGTCSTMGFKEVSFKGFFLSAIKC
jgi:hypothetical protein